MKLKISANCRFIADENCEPFFYLADTAWEMLHRLSWDETQLYLRDRAAKGFTVIQTVILAEEDGLCTPNENGDHPLLELDPTQPNESYFEHVDRVLQFAAEQGLLLGLLPTWGDKWNQKWGQGPEVFTPYNARIYGEYLGRRYANTPNIIWILGGDRPVENDVHRAIIMAMAEGIEAGGSTHLKTYHPHGGAASSEHWHEAQWLDFNMWQTGHGRNSPNYQNIAADYARDPVKPTLDGEPGYEDHKAGFVLENGFLDDYDCRKALYWALFSGACGHTYGCHNIWQFWQKGRKGVNHPRRSWQEALSLPGAGQMVLARNLHDRYPFLNGSPAPELIVAQPESGAFHISAISGTNADFALLYFPTNSTVEVSLKLLRGEIIRASWFNPRDGEIESHESLQKTTTRQFTPPDWGPDWILILEAAE